MKNSLDFTENVLKQKVKSSNRKPKYTITNYIQDKLTDLQGSPGRNIIRIDGIKEPKNLTWQKCEEEVQKVFQYKLGLNHIDVEHAHRVEKSDKQQ